MSSCIGPHVLHVFGEGIRVVEAEVANPTVFLSNPEAEGDGFGVPYVEEPVGLRGKAGLHPAPVGAFVLMFRHDSPDEIRAAASARLPALPCHAPPPFSQGMCIRGFRKPVRREDGPSLPLPVEPVGSEISRYQMAAGFGGGRYRRGVLGLYRSS